MPSKSSPKSKPFFFDGQKDFGNALFAPGGFFESLLGGAPDPGTERGIQRNTANQADALASQGLTGSGLAAKSISDSTTQTNFGLQDNLFEKLMAGIQPAGSIGSGGSSGLFAK